MTNRVILAQILRDDLRLRKDRTISAARFD
jgi:hypothetical protein